MPITIRTARESEREIADRIAQRSFAEYEREYPAWIPILDGGNPMSKIAEEGELFVVQLLVRPAGPPRPELLSLARGRDLPVAVAADEGRAAVATVEGA